MKLEKASYKAIKYACINFHYAKRIPVVLDAYSVFNDKKEWCGVICYGSGAGNTVSKSFKMQQGKLCELVRVALNGKQESTSKAVSISLRLLKKNNPLIKLVYSYADIDQNHYGTIYQATNWIYLGQNKPYKGGFIINGKNVHTRSASQKIKGFTLNIKNIQKHIDKKAEVFISQGKRKYVYVFDKTVFDEINKNSKPYPKKVER